VAAGDLKFERKRIQALEVISKTDLGVRRRKNGIRGNPKKAECFESLGKLKTIRAEKRDEGDQRRRSYLLHAGA